MYETTETIEVTGKITQKEQPVIAEIHGTPVIITKDDYNIHEREHLLPAPLRKDRTSTLDDALSFIDFVKLHNEPTTTIFISMDEGEMVLEIRAIFNGHHEKTTGWGDHRAIFSPKKSEEWKRWVGNNGRKFTQLEFARFIESRLPDINNGGDSTLPTASELLTFATKLEDTRRVSFKSGINMQNGMVQLSFVEDGDSSTQGNIAMYREFSLGLRPFINGDAYGVRAYLRYSIERDSGKLTMWYELQQVNKVFTTASEEVIKQIKESISYPIFYGSY
jgi:uncharacterized protein YfdQ (DUF2303 family)